MANHVDLPKEVEELRMGILTDIHKRMQKFTDEVGIGPSGINVEFVETGRMLGSRTHHYLLNDVTLEFRL